MLPFPATISFIPEGAVLRDRDVRVQLNAIIAADFAHGPTLVVEELGLCYGSARVDIAAVNGAMHGWEIKSEADRLDRLRHQIRIYDQIFDYMTLVVASRHIAAARRLVPPQWGLWEARVHGGMLQILPRRKPRINKQVHAAAVAQLLWRDEIELELKRLGLRGYSREPLGVLVEWLAASAPLPALQEIVRERLRSRPGWPTVGRRIQCGD